MTYFLQECSAQFSNSMAVLTVLVIGSVALLTRRSHSARAGAAVLLGLLIFLVPWLLVSCVLVSYFYPPGSTPTPHVDAVVADLAMYVWSTAYAVAETVAVILMARVLRDAARDVQPVECAGPLVPGDALEATMSKKNHSPGPVPPGNRAGGGDKGSPDTGAEHAPPQDGTGFAEEDPQRRLGGFTGKGEHSIQQPTPRQDGDAKAK